MKKITSFFVALLINASFSQAEVITITEGSSSGYTMTDGNTYIIQESASFSNSVAGGNGMAVDDGATVVIYIPTNVTLTAIGADSDGQIGGGAGIYVPSNSTLVVTGEGTLYAKGGNAGNGGDGANGEAGFAALGSELFGNGGTGGTGGYGGGGAGSAGSAIGGSGGKGGDGGFGGIGGYSYRSVTGGDGNSGMKGSSAPSMGSLYLLGSINVSATQGNVGTFGTAGNFGTCGIASRATDWGPVYCRDWGGGGGGGGGSDATAQDGIGQGSADGGGDGGGGGGISDSVDKNNNNDTAGIGGGGNGGKSLSATGMDSNCKESAYLPGEGGAGRDYGDDGDGGMVFKSDLVTLETNRDVESAETHNAAQYSIEANPNGGVFAGKCASIIPTLGVKMPHSSFPIPLRPDYQFLGRATAPTGGIMYYNAEGNPLISCYPCAESITLYTQWENLLANSGQELVSDDGYEWLTTITIRSPAATICVPPPFPMTRTRR